MPLQGSLQQKSLFLKKMQMLSENMRLLCREHGEKSMPVSYTHLEKAHALKGEYDSVSDEMGSIYYKGFSEEEITLSLIHISGIIVKRDRGKNV